MRTPRYDHTLQYQQRDGTWTDGFLGYTHLEAMGVARESVKRTGRSVRVMNAGKIIRTFR